MDDGNANTSMAWHAGRLLALKEAALPTNWSRLRWKPAACSILAASCPGARSPHPKIDPLTGEMITFSCNSSDRPDRDVNVFVISPAGQVTRTGTFQAPYSSMMHD